MLLPRTLVILTTSVLLSSCFNRIRRNGFGLGFVRVSHYAKSQSCVKAVSPYLRQRRGIGLRSRSLLRHAMCQARNQLGTPGGRRVFWEWPKFFKLCPILSNYVQHIFPGGRKIF